MNNLDHQNRPVVAVTGIGIVSPLAIGKDENWEKLKNGESGIRKITRFKTDGLNTTIAGTVELDGNRPACSPEHTYALADMATEEAVGQAGIHPNEAGAPLFLGTPPVEMEWAHRMELDSAEPDNETDGYQRLLDAAEKKEFTEMFEQVRFSGTADKLAKKYKTKGLPISLSTACASGASIIQLGVEAIQRGETNSALCVATDGSINIESLIRFSLLSALTTQNENPTKASKPFSKGRDGFVMAEGAGALMLESLEHARNRNAKVLAVIKGCGEKADFFHRTRSSPDGAPIIAAIKNCLNDANLKPEEVSYINAHGTSTPENDKMEYIALQKVFGCQTQKTPISSNKSMIGHTLTAAGAIEAVFSILTIQNQTMPPTINYDNPDPDIKLDVVPNVAREAEVNNVLSNSFGFGGQNTCLIFGKYDA